MMKPVMIIHLIALMLPANALIAIFRGFSRAIRQFFLKMGFHPEMCRITPVNLPALWVTTRENRVYLSANQVEQWVEQQLVGLHWLAEGEQAQVTAMTGDASFRQYYRVATQLGQWVVMVAPPAVENVQAFVDVAERLAASGICVPMIHASDLAQGLLLLDDLGDDLYRQLINDATVEPCFAEIIPVLGELARAVSTEGLAPYNPVLLQQELDEFPEWYLQHHKQQPFSVEEQQQWQQFCQCLLAELTAQPQVFVHRDFMSSNLLRTADGQVGVIDFQDAVQGPVTYDLASLLWDRYDSWPRPQLENWIEQARQAVGADVPAEVWRRWCDWTGLQRNLKIVGRFARLNYRDGKPAYLELMPRFIQFVKDALALYPELAEYRPLLESRL